MERSVCILWHCHQPCYRDALTGEVLLPWVRLHAARAYGEMPRRLLEADGARAIFNLTPVLVDQLEACGRGASDAWWAALAKPVEDLDAGERRLLLKGLRAVQGRAAERWPAHRAALARAEGGGDVPGQDLRDLAVWFLLAWCGPTLLDESGSAGLLEKGSGFSEADKSALMERMEGEGLSALEAFRRAQESGRAELSTSPYYHPILPLLCDAAAADPTPGVQPPLAFREPSDARTQVAEAYAAHARRFGVSAAGFWPSEGAVSPEALSVLASVPIRWVVTDQAILRQGMALEGRDPAPDHFLTPHRVPTESGDLAVFFRDTGLSDLIGFEYARWPDSEAAAQDLVDRIDALPRGKGGSLDCVTLALDGENAWGYYVEGGRPFLRALYARLSGHPRLRMRTFSEHLEAAGGLEALPVLRRVGTGSWIYGSLGTWAAHPNQRRAWALLREARARCGRAGMLDALHLAEGSDWFWWLGSDHQTDQQDLFVRLFVSAVRKGCRDAAVPEPEGLAAWARSLGGGA